MGTSESQVISRYFDRTVFVQKDVETGIGDDCALVNISRNNTLAISTDTLVEGVHFLHDISPCDLAYKALAVNLSDLAATGAEPVWLTLSITLPNVNNAWLQVFSDSLFKFLSLYKVQLIGGNTTRGPLSITLTVYGTVPKGYALKRSGACIGDWIYVTGTLGDSIAGLLLLQNQVSVNNSIIKNVLIKRHLRPTPRVVQGQALRHLASSAIDLSDGLLSDLRHILKASDCGARIDLNSLPISSELRDHFPSSKVLKWALSGGEDYELCFTISNKNRLNLDIALGKYGVDHTCIGRIVPKTEGLTIFDHDKPVDLLFQGFDHFINVDLK
ncbi:Thiamine-monophosphate kinase [Candidatus Erwinia haradaeae]|uniref:Thiamine-monophosphate kinase n=1 Tax=Candidatus Erwinia haradaeae TaxID=1922217 RepID=A0A451CYW1_9GAMM|nr:thiamine-phosphate kinase [Candidatus Erwinia haradaeae]VFP78559.1 Thiamine-monophosphate kinase [Candidatus Erwinia haradaeae]